MQQHINVEQIAELGGVSRATAYRWIKQKDFPKAQFVPRTADRGPAKIKGWKREEVLQWLGHEEQPTAHETVADSSPEVFEENDRPLLAVALIIVIGLAIAGSGYFAG